MKNIYENLDMRKQLKNHFGRGKSIGGFGLANHNVSHQNKTVCSPTGCDNK